MKEHFGTRLAAAIAQHGPLCAGIDPHPGILSDWGVEDSSDGLSTFAQVCLEAFAGKIAVVKPQSAFFERFGYAGMAVLEHMVEAFRRQGTLVILDAKRGDLGSTMTAYAEAYLAEGSPLQCDALTVNPYMGVGSLRPAFQRAANNGAGLYVLGLTSNPEGHQVQHCTNDEGQSVAAQVISEVHRANEEFDGPVGPFGVVVGGTIGDGAQKAGVDLQGFNGSFLVPGYGAQGARVEDIAAVFGSGRGRLVVNSSRGILNHGPSVTALRAAADRANEELAALESVPAS